MATRRTSCRSRRNGPKGFGAAVTWGKGEKQHQRSRRKESTGKITSEMLCSPSQSPAEGTTPLLPLPFKALTASQT